MRAFDLLSKAEQDLKLSSQPRHLFEMALVKWIHLRKLTPLSDLIAAAEGGTAASALRRQARAQVAPASAQAPGRSPKPQASREPRAAKPRAPSRQAPSPAPGPWAWRRSRR